MSPFSIESFAAQTKHAMAEAPDGRAAAARMLSEAIAEHGPDAIIAALQAAVPPGADVGELIVHASPELTMLYARVPAHFQSGIHNHTVCAVIGQLRGEEVNTTYRPGPDGLEVVEQQTARLGTVLQLDSDVIHSIANPGDELAHALHLYGGDFRTLGPERSLWNEETHEEMPFSFPALLGQSVAAMRKSGNDAGLATLVEAIPAARALIEAPVV